jgi:transposase
MDSANATLPDLDGLSIAELKSLLQRQHAEIIAKDTRLLSNTMLIESLELQILALRRQQFGRRSEKREHEIDQLELWVEDLEIIDAQCAGQLPERSPSKPAAARKPRRAFPAHLPRETTTIMPREEHCPDCGGNLKHLGEDVSEMLELEPVRFKVIRRVRPKLACANCDTIVQAPAPTRPIERGMAGPGLLAHVVVSKFADHLPLYRQAEIYAREGLDLDRSLLAQWVGATTQVLMPLVDALRAHVLAAEALHADDTPIPCAGAGQRHNQNRPTLHLRARRTAGSGTGGAGGVVYLQHRPQGPASAAPSPRLHRPPCTPTVLRVIPSSTKAIACAKRLAGRMSDASSSISINCITRPSRLRRWIASVGSMPSSKRSMGDLPTNGVQVRQERSRPLLDALHVWCTQTIATLSQKSATAKAIRYALTRWEALLRYCDDGRIEIDNNAAERALRCVALGGKNYLFAGSDGGGENAAALYSLLGSAKLNGLNLEMFLREVLTRIADHPINRIAELLPWNIKLRDPALAVADEAPQLAAG